jgi:hypothetical protein
LYSWELPYRARAFCSQSFNGSSPVKSIYVIN